MAPDPKSMSTGRSGGQAGEDSPCQGQRKHHQTQASPHSAGRPHAGCFWDRRRTLAAGQGDGP